MELPEEFKFLFGEDILTKPYRGKLTVSEASLLINAIIANAIDLCVDSTLLFERGRFARSLSLSNLALEEMGKAFIVLNILAAPNQNKLNDAWSEFVSHRDKNYTWLLPLLNEMRDEISLETYTKLTNNKGDFSFIPHQLKMNGFYVDVDLKRNIIKPQNIDKGLADHFLKTAITVSTEDVIWKDENCLKIWAKYHIPPGNGKDRISLFTELADLELITRERATKIIENIRLQESL